MISPDPELRRTLLVDLFRLAAPFLLGVSKQSFQVRHHELIEVIDALVSSGEIRENQGRLLPSLLSLTTLGDKEVQSFLQDCERVYEAMRNRYLENQVDTVGIDALAGVAGLDLDRFYRALALLKENLPLVGGSQGTIGEPDFRLLPSDHVLRMRTLPQAIEDLRKFQSAVGRGALQLERKSAQPVAQRSMDQNDRHGYQWFTELPAGLGALMAEIHVAQREGLRALAVMGVRAAVDMACNDMVGDRGGFGEKLRLLADQGHISTAQLNTLTVVVDLGHASAHRGHIPQIGDVEAVIDILERLVKFLYLDSKTTERIKQNTPARPR